MSIKITKFLSAALYLHMFAFQYLFPGTSSLVLLITLAVYFFSIMYIIEWKESINLRYIFTPEISILIIFTLSIFIGGLFVAEYKAYFFSLALSFIQFFLLCITLLLISDYDNGTDFLRKILSLLGIIIAVKTIFMGEGYYGSERISFTKEANPNAMGQLLVIGIYCLMTNFIGSSPFKKIIQLISISAMVYTIMLTGSRKALISLILMISAWLLTTYLPMVFKKNSLSYIIRSLFLIFFAFSLIALYWNQISETLMFQRLFRLSDELEGGKRVSLYSEAIEFFLKSPLLGIGFANNAMHSKYGAYSHSTYAEALSCTGVIGTVLYFGSYVIVIKNTFKAYIISKRNKNERDIISIKLLFGLIIVMLFSGVGIVLFYNMFGMIILALLIGYNNKIFKANTSSV